MGRFGAKKCALLQCVFGRSRLTHSHHLLGKRVRRRYYRFVNRDMERGDRQAGGVVMGQGEMSQKTLYILACLSLNVYDIYIILRVRYRRMGKQEKCHNHGEFTAQ